MDQVSPATGAELRSSASASARWWSHPPWAAAYSRWGRASSDRPAFQAEAAQQQTDSYGSVAVGSGSHRGEQVSLQADTLFLVKPEQQTVETEVPLEGKTIFPAHRSMAEGFRGPVVVFRRLLPEFDAGEGAAQGIPIRWHGPRHGWERRHRAPSGTGGRAQCSPPPYPC